MATLRTIIAVTTSAAAAQDFAPFDFTAINRDWNNSFNSANDRIRSKIVQTNMNDPHVIGMYQQQMQSAQFYGSLADCA